MKCNAEWIRETDIGQIARNIQNTVARKNHRAMYCKVITDSIY